MNVAALLRRPKPEPEAADTLAPLVSKRDALAARVAALRDRAAALDSDEAAARAALEAAAASGEETESLASELAALTARRGPLALEANAAAAALAAADAAVKAEDARLREAATDAKIADLRAAEEEAEAAYREVLIAAGVAYERLLRTERNLDRALTDAKRTGGRGFMDSGYRSTEAAEEEARKRLAAAIAEGEAGPSSYLALSDQRPRIPFGRAVHF